VREPVKVLFGEVGVSIPIQLALKVLGERHNGVRNTGAARSLIAHRALRREKIKSHRQRVIFFAVNPFDLLVRRRMSVERT
jgi:hypothetical protein